MKKIDIFLKKNIVSIHIDIILFLKFGSIPFASLVFYLSVKAQMDEIKDIGKLKETLTKQVSSMQLDLKRLPVDVEEYLDNYASEKLTAAPHNVSQTVVSLRNRANEIDNKILRCVLSSKVADQKERLESLNLAILEMKTALEMLQDDDKLKSSLEDAEADLIISTESIKNHQKQYEQTQLNINFEQLLSMNEALGKSQLKKQGPRHVQ